MDPNWAEENLKVIRTLMERSAVYRRALAPVMVLAGVLGTIAGLAGWLLLGPSPEVFLGYWMGVAGLAGIGALLLVRSQALKDAEPFWSPPTRRVAQAMLPAISVGAFIGLLLLIAELLPEPADPPPGEGDWIVIIASVAWVILYGCAMHAAGFFMTRGIRLFGWIFIVGGCLLLIPGVPHQSDEIFRQAHGIMGFFFGVLHLAYGVYLYFTEQRKNVA